MTMEQTLKQHMDFCRVTEWHNAGFTGKGQVGYNTENKVKNIDHPTLTILKLIAPDATIVTGSMFQNFKGEDMTSFDVHDDLTDTYIKFHEFIEKYKPKVLSASIKDTENAQEYVDYCIEMQKKYDLIINNCAGNEGESTNETLSHRFPEEVAFLIGAVNLIYGRVTKATYSSVGEDLDFMNFTGGVWDGTSFSTPWTAGEELMILQRYGNMSAGEIYLYLKMCAVDMLTIGDDIKTGWGYIRLPEVKKKYITFVVDKKEYTVDGKTLVMDTVPVNVNGTVFIPLRAVSEALGCEVSWNEDTDTATIVDDNDTITKLDDTTIKLTLGSKIALLDDEDADTIFDQKALLIAPYRDVNGRTMVPLRFISENLDCNIEWLQREKKVIILEK